MVEGITIIIVEGILNYYTIIIVSSSTYIYIYIYIYIVEGCTIIIVY